MLGVRAIAAPIQTKSPPAAAIWVVGFTASLDDQKMKTVIREIQEATREINQSLGATHP
jgi:DNA-binding IclR family transcriptional regulator